MPYEAPDQETLERGVPQRRRASAPSQRLGEAEVRRLIAEAAAPFRRRDGSYRFENRFRYLIAAV